MAGFDFNQALADQQTKHRKAGRGMLIAGAIGWLALLAAGGGVVWLLDAMAFIEKVGPVLFNVGLLIMLVFLLLGTAWFYFNQDAEIEVREERSFIEQVSGNNAIAGEVVLAFLLVIPKITAEGLHDLTNARLIPDDQRDAAERIACELHDQNDWLALSRYHADLNTVAALVRMDILRTKEAHGRPYVRLNPSLYK